MKERLNDLSTRYLGECDKILMLIKQLHVDKFEFYVYEELQYGDIFSSEIKNVGEGIFFRARQSMQSHLEELECAYKQSQEIYQEILSIAKMVTDG